MVNLNHNRPKSLWNIVNKILCKDSTGDFSKTFSKHTPDDFATFFREKVEQVRELSMNLDKPIHSNCSMAESKMLTSFLVCSSEDVKKIVLHSPSKSCSLDCLPTYIFKRYIDLFLPFLTSLINLCLRVGYFPFAFKHAIVIPLLKKSTLDKNVISNFRPVSNLTFISKVIERIVLQQLLSHLKKNDLMPSCQSGYRRFHSTETALLQVCSELFASMDKQHFSLLGLLDMSAAFDCVDHVALKTLFQLLHFRNCSTLV